MPVDVQPQLKSIEAAITQIQNPRYREFAEGFHAKMSTFINTAAGSYVQIGSNSASNMIVEYQKIVDSIAKDSALTDPKAFYENTLALSQSDKFKSTTLKTNLGQTTQTALDALTAENLRKMKESREENIAVRHNFSVQALTFVAYACYLNTVSALVPGVSYRVPGSILFLAVAAVTGAQVTAPYNNMQEAWDHVRDISDRVLSNSGLRKCFHIGYKLTEKMAITLNNRIEPYLEGEAPANRRLP